MNKTKKSFTPIAIPYEGRPSRSSEYSLSISTTLWGDVAKEFEKMVKDNNLNRSLLLRQMVWFCLGHTEELENMKRQILLWGTPNDRSENN